MGKYLIDNNVISDYFSGAFSGKSLIFIASIIDETPNLSVITEIEALSWISVDKNKEQVVKEFISDSIIIPLSQAIVNECVRIRRSIKIRTPDAIIAATAIVYDFTLVTNDSDFSRINGLSIINPHKI